MSVNVGTAVGYLDLDASKFKAGLKDAVMEKDAKLQDVGYENY